MRFFMSMIAVLLPWLALLIKDNPGGAFVALIMQSTVIGWPFAAMWAWRTVHPPKVAQNDSSKEQL